MPLDYQQQKLTLLSEIAILERKKTAILDDLKRLESTRRASYKELSTPLTDTQNAEKALLERKIAYLHLEIKRITSSKRFSGEDYETLLKAKTQIEKAFVELNQKYEALLKQDTESQVKLESYSTHQIHTITETTNRKLGEIKVQKAHVTHGIEEVKRETSANEEKEVVLKEREAIVQVQLLDIKREKQEVEDQKKQVEDQMSESLLKLQGATEANEMAVKLRDKAKKDYEKTVLFINESREALRQEEEETRRAKAQLAIERKVFENAKEDLVRFSEELAKREVWLNDRQEVLKSAYQEIIQKGGKVNG